MTIPNSDNSSVGLNVTDSRDLFFKYMKFAHEVESYNPKGLIEVIRLLGSLMLSDVLKWRITSRSDDCVNPTCPDWALFPLQCEIGVSGVRFYDICPDKTKNMPIDLAKNLVLPFPWNRGRLAKNLASIGVDKSWGEWRYDNQNHLIEYWYPMGVAWCVNGNHSITTGILLGEGVLKTAVVRDITPLFAHVQCDGEWYSNKAGQKIAPVNSPEFAAIFEIGRLLIKHGINPSP